MHTINAFLGGIDIWLREQGHKSALNLSYRKGSPCFGGVPNITMPDSKLLLQIKGDRLVVVRVDHDEHGVIQYCGNWSLELCDPVMFDQLGELVRENHA